MPKYRWKPELIARMREAKGWSQETLTKELYSVGLNVTRPTISSWETGRTAPDANQLIILANVLADGNVNALYEIESNPESTNAEHGEVARRQGGTGKARKGDQPDRRSGKRRSNR